MKRQIRKIEVLICTWGNSLLLFQAFLLNRVTWSSNKCKLGRWYVMIHCVRTFWENCTRTLFIHSQIANIPLSLRPLRTLRLRSTFFLIFNFAFALLHLSHRADCIVRVKDEFLLLGNVFWKHCWGQATHSHSIHAQFQLEKEIISNQIHHVKPPYCLQINTS